VREHDRVLSRSLVTSLALLALPVLFTGCENENVIACESYVESFGAKGCTVGIDPGVDCNAYADYPCAVPDYFSCLETTQQCRDGELYICNDTNPDAPDPQCLGLTLSACADELDCG